MPAQKEALRLLCIAVALALTFAGSARAQDSVADFYHGKQIDFVIGYSPGGAYDFYARLVARHMGDHIPGHPAIVPRNMPGAGGRVAATWVYAAGPKDGTVLATSDQSMAIEQAMGDKSLKVDTTKLIYIGNPVSDNNTTVTWYTSGVKTIDDARKKEIPIGATGASPSSQYPRAMNALLGTKFKIIYGYPGANDINLAMEKGEVAGQGSDSWAKWKAVRPDWLRDKKINILVQIGLEKAPDLPNVPLLMDLAKNSQDRAVLKLLSTPSLITRQIFTTPGAPPARIEALRRAFDATMKDPGFLADAAKAHAAVDPVSGEKLQQLVSDIIATPQPIADRLAQIVGQVDKPGAR